MEMDAPSPQIVPVPAAVPPDYVEFDTNYQDDHFTQRTPIVIDNGATDLRYGFASSSTPHTSPNVVSKYKERKQNRQLLLFGNAVEADSASRMATKSPWEGDILCSSDALEAGLDFAFIRLGIDSPSVDHPIIMSERLCSPLPSRSLTSELMFECYGAPSVTYAVDALLSHYQNRRSISTLRDGLVVSFNTSSTSVIPVLDGQGLLNHAKRLPWGGFQASDYLLKLVQLKYPGFATKVTPQQSNWMLHNFGAFSPNYAQTLERLNDPTNITSSGIIIQFPFAVPVTESKTEEELARQAEKRKESGRRLQEQAAKARVEKLLQKETDLQDLLNLKAYKAKDKKADFIARLRAENIESEQSLDDEIKRIEFALRRARRKEEGLDEEPGEEPSFPLVDVPDHELNEDQIKEKRRQRLMKAGYDARLRARAEKEKWRLAREEQDRQEEREREADSKTWAARVRKEHSVLMEKLKERKRTRAALTDRKSAAAQSRMKNIASLADDQPVTKKRKKGGNEDMFGENDDDWAIYRQITLDNANEEEEEDLVTLSILEHKLLTHDPTFSVDETYDAIAQKRSALMSAFRPIYEEGDVEGAHRIHLNVERWRVPEAWFSPSMAGVDSAGLGEIVEGVLKSLGEAEKHRLVKDVFLTGGPSLLPGLTTRLEDTLRPILSPGTQFTVNRAADPQLDAWRGMASFAQTEEFGHVGVSKAEYQEWGGERIKKWWGGNWNSAV